MANECPKCQAKKPDTQSFCGECGTPLEADVIHTKSLKTPAEELKRGSVFSGRYEIIEELGKGGMGKVYRVEDTKTKEELALKLISPAVSSDRNTIKRFINELKITHKISHRNVCRMYHLGEDKGNFYITMEYVSGEDLKSMIRMTRRLSIGTAVSITKQVCYGLAEAHRLGIVHRDLKPSNIMIDREGNARIMDFGIARSFKDKGITGAGVMIGTPEYMSPEQVDAKKLDHQSDIYSLGVILFEMVTGRLPFEGNTSLQIAMKHMSETPTDPRSFNSQVPEELSSLILKCLEKDRAKRFQLAEEVVAELAKIEKGMSTTQQSLAKEKIDQPVKKKNMAFRFGWMAVLVLVLILGTWSILSLLKRKPPVVSGRNMLVVLPFENLGAPEDEYFAAGITEEITSRLAVLQGLGVISRTSAIQYRDTNKTIRQIAEELNVDYVLEGSVRWNRSAEGNGRVRVTPQLVRVADDMQVWSERYDRVIEDIFSVQYEIAEQVARNLDLTVLEPERRALNANPTDNIEAWDYFLRGREHEDRGWAFQDLDEFAQALEFLEKATELDPNFVLSFARQTYIHARMYFFGDDHTDERLAKAREAANNAAAVQADHPDALWAMGFYHYWCLLDYDRATEIFKEVQRARPNFDPQLLGYIQRRQGKWDESTATLERAFRINPRDQQIAYELGGTNVSLGRYEQAEIWFNRCLEIYPQHLPALLGKVGIFVLDEGDTQKARALLETLPSHQLTDYMWVTIHMLERNYTDVMDRINALTYDSYEDQHFYFQKNLSLAGIHFVLSETSQMRRNAQAARLVLEPIVQARPDDPRFHTALGLVYAYLGERDDALREGNQAASLHPPSRDAGQGPIYMLNMARIYTVLGEAERAIEQLEFMLSNPHAEFLWHLVSRHQLRLDPQWDSLRDNPRFQALLSEDG